MMRWLLVLLVSWPAAAAPVLERVVIVSRHGVRSPTKPVSSLADYSSTPWQAWPVEPGELTPHGAAALREMGRWLRVHYAAARLLPAAGCPDAADVSVWADIKDHRTMDSGAAILDGIAPGCGISLGHAGAGNADPLFGAVEAGWCPLDTAEQQKLVAETTAALAALPPSYAAGLSALADVLKPPSPLEGTNKAVPGEEGTRIRGPLSTGSTLAEDLSLEYLQGMSRPGLDEAKLETIMALHALSSKLGRRNPVVAGHNGSALAARILTLLDDPHAPKFSLFMGHDTQLDNLAGIFDLSWTLPGQADLTPPDGELVFERWRNDDGTAAIRVIARYQTGAQIRAAAPLTAADPARDVALSPAYCGGTGCTLGALRAQAAKTVPASCEPHG